MFVCLGNICRSPMAEGMFRAKVEAAGLGDNIVIDSAGTGTWNLGKAPDPRAAATARRHGVELGGTARQISRAEVGDWDFIVVMDGKNKRDVLGLGADGDRVHMLRDFDPEGQGDVIDPYYGDDDGFEQTHHMLKRSLPGLLAAVKERL